MNKYLYVLNSFLIMLCLGSVYAWSIFVPELKDNYGFTTTQTQLIFGVLIATFPLTMVIAGKWERKFGPHVLAMLSATFFGLGYVTAGLSKGNFFFVLLGISILGGMGTGFGYLVSITNPVKWFPNKKGFVTGIAAAGFGLGAIVLSWFVGLLLESGSTVLEIFRTIGLTYGAAILLLSFLLKEPVLTSSAKLSLDKEIFKGGNFIKLVTGIFCGTFAGLLVIGNLRPIGAQFNIDNDTLLLGISFFSVANFAGRLVWGWLSDYMNGKTSIPLALGLLGTFVFLIGFVQLTPVSYILLSIAIGFCFGANFVLFAKETVNIFGIGNMGPIYPYVFLGYAVAGILGPVTGGYIYDLVYNYSYASYIAAIVCIFGAFMFLAQHFKKQKKSPTI